VLFRNCDQSSAGYQTLVFQQLLDPHPYATEGFIHVISALVFQVYTKISREFIIQPKGYLDVTKTRFLGEKIGQVFS
jgi:hypothetical protein